MSETKKDQPQCAKCGACTTPCPIYKISGDEALSPRGRLHLLSKLGGKIHSERCRDIFSRCLLCGACYATCPRGINIPEIMKQARKAGADKSGVSTFKRRVIQQGLTHPEVMTSTINALKSMANSAKIFLPQESGLRIKLSSFEHYHTKQKGSFSDSYNPPSSSQNYPKAMYFIGCLANHVDQRIAAATIACVRHICQYELIPITGQTCCGIAFDSSGTTKQSLDLARKNIDLLSQESYRDLPIITSCASCYSHLKSYATYFNNDKKWGPKAEAFIHRLREFSSFLLCNKVRSFTQKISKEKHVFYHDPCHLRFPQTGPPITKEPRLLLQGVPNTVVHELAGGSQCCGQGGLFRLTHPKDSHVLADLLLKEVDQHQVDSIITTCSGCLIQLAQATNNHPYSVEHLAVFLNRYIPSDLSKR